ncbi:dipeptide epimerase [Candidatus Nitronereus thalassa]|uniref:Dipeptide epimerase n=1 Tax=Candidatus Nitronereus thalassa TaxID=3020898 RepID=A0ABU3K505_9BACT|nr:dipeptide epimerase [Candidatus Nitronereus thalassa]MDT7041439.1 dipeptide epimerase [Candidatus Nitronereus thalassa]
MTSLDRTAITKIQLWTLDIPTTDPFVVATGQLNTAQNIIVKLTLRDGSVGFGEIAPFTDITGETVTDSLKTAQSLANSLLGTSVYQYRRLAQQFQNYAPNFPATRCGMETAVLDALCRSAGIPLWTLWGGADVRERETDITIPICNPARTLTLGQEWYERGFRLFKMKVGHDVDKDIQRIETLHQSLPDVTFLVDPNQGFTRDAAATFIEGVKKVGGIIEILEQPLPKDDLEGAAWLSQTYHIPIAADESVQTVSDAQLVIQHKAANFINLKITKSGVLETLDIVTLAKQSDLKLMIGGMLETRITMGCSFSLVLGFGGIEYLDLDTPLLLETDPVKGGYTYRCSYLQPWYNPGLGVSLPPPANSEVIQ